MQNQKTKQLNIRNLTTAAILTALSVVLSFAKLYEFPLGGSITLFSMVPVMCVSYIFGIKWGLSAGFCYSLTQLLFGSSVLAYVFTPVGVVSAVLLDFIVPFTAIGLAGMTRNISFVSDDRKNAYITNLSGCVAVCVLRFISHFVVGAVVWYELTKAGNWNDYVNTVGMWTYSFIYNGTYLLPETLICIVGVTALTPVITRFRSRA